MALSVVDLVQRVLPRTNCGACGYPTCLAFASMVVSQKMPLKQCPHLSAATVARYQPELDAQHAAGKWIARDLAADALDWARRRAASMSPADQATRVGGTLVVIDGQTVLELPYFNDRIRIDGLTIRRADGGTLERWEQVFIFNHLAQGGSRPPSGRWIALQELPNTISKIKSLQRHVEDPLRLRFAGRRDELAAATRRIGGQEITAQDAADLVVLLQPLPRVPARLSFWDADPDSGLDAEVKLAFDETIVEHLDIESILFLCETIAKALLHA